MDTKIKCYVLTATTGTGDAEVTLRRPSTSRHRIVDIVHQLYCGTPKDSVEWTISIVSQELTDDEFKAMHKAWDEEFVAELMALGFKDELAEHAANVKDAPAQEKLDDPGLSASLTAQLEAIYNQGKLTYNQGKLTEAEEKISESVGQDVTVEIESDDEDES